MRAFAESTSSGPCSSPPTLPLRFGFKTREVQAQTLVAHIAIRAPEPARQLGVIESADHFDLASGPLSQTS